MSQIPPGSPQHTGYQQEGGSPPPSPPPPPPGMYPPGPYGYPPGPKRGNSAAVASLVFGLLGCTCLPVLSSTLATLLGNGRWRRSF